MVLAAVDSTCYLFRHYKTDIVSSNCPTTITDHTVLIVGYGVYTYVPEDDPEMSSQSSYYIIRNSWGTDWGVSGYMRIGFDENSLSDGWLGI